MNGQYRECPFCDKDGFQEVEEATFKTHTEYRVACANCGAHGPNEISVEQAIKKWNLRRPFDMLQAQLIGLNQRITAFAGQLQAWGYENAARELISEILGGIVDAPDYYTLQDELARRTASLHYANTVCMEQKHVIDRLKEDAERLAELPYPPLSGMSSQDNFDRGTACKYCHKVRSVGHAPDCPITLHRALMKELE